MAPYLQNIKETRLFLKDNFHGPEVVKALRFRLQTHLEDPMLDPLSRQVWPGYLKLPDLLEEPFTLLDAGCMSGFLYHHLKKYFKDFVYTGLDRWEEALEVGRDFAPEVRFILGDFLENELDDDYDYIVCSNIGFSGNQCQIVVERLQRHTRRALIFISPNGKILTLTPPAST